jgi:hypothetical protein
VISRSAFVDERVSSGWAAVDGDPQDATRFAELPDVVHLLKLW